MAEQLLHQMADEDLESALRGLASAIDWPATAVGEPDGPADLATTVRTRVASMPVPASDRWAGLRAVWPGRRGRRPARRALVLALITLLAVAAIAGAVGLGLPGLRFILGEPSPGAVPSVAPATRSPGSPSPQALGGSMRLGTALDPADAATLDDRAGFHVAMPADPTLGPPETAWIDEDKGGQVTLLWPAGPELPPTLEPDVGLLLSQFRGVVDTGLFNKLIDGGTIVAPLEVAGHEGYWLSGDPHVFFWEGSDGFVDDGRRWVGDVLVWSDGPITYRLETSLSRDEAIRIAESIR